MNAVLSHPAFQSAVAPFAVSLVLAALLRHAGARWQGLAILAGWLAVVGLAVGFQLEPLTSTRKLILAGAVLPLLTPSLEWTPLGLRSRLGVMVLAALLAILWILWPVLARSEFTEVLPKAAGLLGYVAFVVLSFGLLALKGRESLGAAGLALALGTGGAAMLGASALYGQLGLALAAACGGLILSGLLRRNLAAQGQMTAMGLAIPLSFIGAAGTVYADLTTWVLPSLALVPIVAWAAWFPLQNIRSPWGRMTAVSLAALLPALLAIWTSWQTSGEMIY